MRLPIVLALTLSALALLACDSEEDDPALRAAAIAREIRANPDGTEAILDEHDMTIEEFEALMYDVAADPEMSQRYQAAVGTEE